MPPICPNLTVGPHCFCLNADIHPDDEDVDVAEDADDVDAYDADYDHHEYHHTAFVLAWTFTQMTRMLTMRILVLPLPRHMAFQNSFCVSVNCSKQLETSLLKFFLISWYVTIDLGHLCHYTCTSQKRMFGFCRCWSMNCLQIIISILIISV